jgi:transcriptional regulator with XRE-family HTH domain
MSEETASEVNLAAFAQRMRDGRRATGLRQIEVAERVGVRRRAVWAWEAGEQTPKTALPAVAELYGTTPRYLLYGEAPKPVEVVAELEELRAQVVHLSVQLTALAEQTEAAFEALRLLLEARILGPDQAA